MVPWRFSRNEISRRPGRALLTLLSVVIGVATLLAVSISIATTRRAFREMYQTLAGKAALEVRADGGGGFDADVLDLLDAAPGVRAAVPVLQRQSILYLRIASDRNDGAGDRPGTGHPGPGLLLRGRRLIPRGRRGPLGGRIRRGPRHSTGRPGAAAQRARAAKLHGGRPVGAARGRQRFPAAASSSCRWPRRKVCSAPRPLNTVYLVLDDGVPEDRVVEELSDQLPEGLSVGPPAARTEMARETLLSTEQGLSMAGALSMVAAAFIIVNSFFMNLTERRRQLATLRAIGAMRWQIVALVVREGLLLGLPRHCAGHRGRHRRRLPPHSRHGADLPDRAAFVRGALGAGAQGSRASGPRCRWRPSCCRPGPPRESRPWKACGRRSPARRMAAGLGLSGSASD